MMNSTSNTSDAKLDEWLRINRDTTHVDVICKEINERAKQVKQHLSSRRPPDIFFVFCMKLFDRVFGHQEHRLPYDHLVNIILHRMLHQQVVMFQVVVVVMVSTNSLQR